VAVRDALVVRAAHPLLDVIDDAVGVLRPRVVARDDHVVREPLCDRAHLRPLAAVAVAAAAERDDEPPLRERSHGHERALERVRRVRIIAKHRRSLVDTLQTARYLWKRGESPRDLVVREPERPRRGRRAQCVRDVEVTNEWKPSRRACTARLELPFAAARRVADVRRAHIGVVAREREANLSRRAGEHLRGLVISVDDRNR
jgi:hypothetical protein